MSQAMAIRVSELAGKIEALEAKVSALEHFAPKNGSETTIPLEIRIRELENKYRMLNARMAKE